MKIKTDFITNSSSSSFVIGKHYISAFQRDLIFNHADIAGNDDAWTISEDIDTIKGWTYMDNFDMIGYLISIGVPSKYITWDKY